MIIFDSHIHTRFSTDSKMEIEAAIKRAEALNIGLIITEHMDIKYPFEDSFVFNEKQYFETYSKYRDDYLLLGIELGMRTDCFKENKFLIEGHPFDYVIGSIHMVDGVDIFHEEFYEGRSKRESYEHYLKYMLDCLKTHIGFIDALGHIDYISRYARYNDKEIYYKDFSEHIDAVLRIVAENGKALEINTRRLDDVKAAENLSDICKRFSDLGGKLVTIGSDAHTPTSIGNNLALAKYIADSSNLNVVHFKERKPQYEK